jgi:flagellar hook-associated protein 3 FlgL
MRVSTNMLSNSFLISLNKSLGRQNEIQEQLSDGKAIHRPSDDPVKTIRALKFTASLTQNEQYTQNVKDATSWMESTDGAMSDLSTILIHAKELAVSADGSKPPTALKAIASELDNMINQIVTIGNSKIGDRYIFAGQMDKTQPMQRITTPTDVVIYAGDQNKISMPLKPGDVNASQDSVNLTGVEVFGPLGAGNTLGVLDHLIALKGSLETGVYDVVAVNAALGNIDADHSRVLQAQTQLGARMSSYELATNLLDQNNEIITKDLSVNTDLDVSKAIIDYKTSESVYKAALSVGSRLMPLSLVDFLK